MAMFKQVADRMSARRCRHCGKETPGQIEYTGGPEDGQRFSNCLSDTCFEKAMSR